MQFVLYLQPICKSMGFIVFIIFAINLLYLKVEGQNSLSGRILDKETQQSLSNVAIYLPDLKIGSTTDSNGVFKIDNLPAGKFWVEVKLIGYIAHLQKVDIKGDTKLEVGLRTAIIEEVVVTGISATGLRKLQPLPTFALQQSQLLEIQATNIIDAVAKKPGISQITTGGGVSKPVIRGLGYNRVLVLNNYIRQEGQQWGDEHGVEIDEYSVDRVEVIKGAGSLMYGSDALAGVIHFLPPNPQEMGTILCRVSTNYQSNNQLFAYSLMNTGNLKGVNWLGRFTQKQASNFTNSKDGKVYNSGYNELNFNGYVGIQKRCGYSQVYFSRFNQNIGLVEGERDSLGDFIKNYAINDSIIETKTVSPSELISYELNLPHQQIEHISISSNSQFIIKNSRLQMNLGYQENRRNEYTNYFNPNEVGLSLVLKTFNYNVRFLLKEIKEWQISLGMNGYLQRNENQGNRILIPNYFLLDGGLIATFQKTCRKFYFNGGIRFDGRNIETLQKQYANLSGSIGCSYRPKEKLILKLNIARGYRIPNFAELASNGMHNGVFRYEIGNTNLKPETSLQIDAGLLFQTDHFSLSVEPFLNNLNNYIFLHKTNLFSTDYAPIFQYTQHNAQLFGGELSVDLHPHPLDWLHFENGFSIVQTVLLNQQDSQKHLPFTPQPRFQSEIRANSKKINFLKNPYIKTEIDYYLPQNQVYTAYQTETKTSAYFLLHFGLGSEIVAKKDKTLFHIHLYINNLLNTSYQNHLNRLKYAPMNPLTNVQGIFNQGINVSIKLIAPIQLKRK